MSEATSCKPKNMHRSRIEKVTSRGTRTDQAPSAARKETSEAQHLRAGCIKQKGNQSH